MMKRKLIFLLVIPSLMILVGCQDDGLLNGSELDMSALGENKKYVVAKTIYKSLKRGENYLSEENEYDQYGNLIKRVNYNEKGEIVMEEKWKYDKGGNLLKKTEEEKTSYLHFIYKYNDQGKRTKWRTKNKTGDVIVGADYRYWGNGELKYRKRINYYNLGQKEEVYYDKKGNPKKGEIKVENGKKINIKYQISYYDNGNKKKQIKEKVYNNEVIESEVIKYNKAENKILRKGNGQFGGMINTWYEWEYDNEGNKIKFIVKNEDGKIEEYEEYSYDENGNTVETKEFFVEDDGKKELFFWKLTIYNDKGIILKKIAKNSDGKITSIWENKFKIINVKRGE